MQPPYRWAVVAMLWAVCFFNYADRQSIFSVFPVLKSEFQLTDLQLGYIGSSFMWVYALSGLFAGWIGDRFPRKSVIVLALIFWSCATAATSLAQNYWQLVAVRALGGFGEAFYFPAAMSLIGDYHGPATRSRAMALHQSGVYAGTVAGASLAGFFAQYYGWRHNFVLFGAGGVLLASFLQIFLREPARARPQSPASSSRVLPAALAVLGNRPALALIAVFIGANFVASIFLSWLPSFLYRKFHMSLSMASFNATAFLQIASVLGVVTGGFLADKLARGNRGGRMLTQAAGLACGVPFLFLTGWTVSVPVLVLAMTGFGYFKGLYDANIFASLFDVVPPERRAIAAGLLNSLGWLGGGLAPVAIAAASARYGMSACISATAAIYAALALVMLRTARRSRNELLHRVPVPSQH